MSYDKEFYAIVRALEYWRHYLTSKEFILHSNHEALKYINSQHKLNNHYTKWVEFLQAYTFLIKHKLGVQNQVVDALTYHQVLDLKCSKSFTKMMHTFLIFGSNARKVLMDNTC